MQNARRATAPARHLILRSAVRILRPVSTFLLAEKRLRLHGILVGSRAMFERMNAAVSAHRLQPIVDRVFPAAAVADAFHHLAGAAHCGKVCVALRGDDGT